MIEDEFKLVKTIYPFQNFSSANKGTQTETILHLQAEGKGVVSH